MGQHDKYLVKYAEGRSTNLAKAWNKVRSWKEFYTRLSTPVRTGETRSKFDEMTKSEQDALKAIDGWISTAQCQNNKRNLKNILPRNLLSLDIDYCEVDTMKAIANADTPLSRFESFTHSSRRHTARKPRLRQFYPLKRDVSPEEYHALVRIVSYIFDGKREPIIQVDSVSARPAQMMFRPTVSKDGDWFSHHQEGALLDPDEIFGLWKKKRGDPLDLANLPLYDQEKELRRSAAESENPLTKRGVIGAFCRAYRIEDVMEKFIPGAYIESGVKNRYLAASGTSTPGAIVFDDGLFLYSFHNHDPAGGKNVNAFDLVRLNKFGHLDEEIETAETDITKLPSYKAMIAFAKEDEGVKHELASEQREVLSHFEDESDEPENKNEEEEEDHIGEDPLPKKSKKEKKGDFLGKLDRDKQLRILPTIRNYNLILQHDPRLRGAIRYNEFTGQINLCKTIKSGIDIIPDKICRDPEGGDLMADEDDSILRAIFDHSDAPGYGIQNHIGNLRDAVVNSARNRPFHPVKTYLESLEWDGENRIDDFLIRFLRLEDTPYNREVSRKMLLASVTRIYEPGHKFDFITILEGPQGIRKSTFIKELYGQRWFGELDCKLDSPKEIMEVTPGKWGMEMPELDSMKKADAPVFKKFMRKQEYVSRMAYGHRATVMLTQFVCWGSTNETKYLRDSTGLRTFWPVACGIEKGDHIDTERVRAERDQLWAEALVEYRRMRQEMPKKAFPDLPLSLSRKAEIEAEKRQESTRLHEIHEEIAERMLEMADEPVLLSALLREYGGAETGFSAEGEIDPETVLVQRCVLLRRDLVKFAYGERNEIITDQVKKTNFDRAMELFLKKWTHQREATKKFQRNASGRWYVRNDASRAERAAGYRVLSVLDDSDDLID